MIMHTDNDEQLWCPMTRFVVFDGKLIVNNGKTHDLNAPLRYEFHPVACMGQGCSLWIDIGNDCGHCGLIRGKE